MYDMSQIQQWMAMANQMKGQGGRGQNEWEAQQGEPNGSAMYQAQLAAEHERLNPDPMRQAQHSSLIGIMEAQRRKLEEEAELAKQTAANYKPQIYGGYGYNPLSKVYFNPKINGMGG